MSILRTYDPAEHVFSFVGNLFTAFGPDTFIEAERAEDSWTMTVGASGETTRARNRNRSGRVTLTLKAMSPENNILANILALDEEKGLGVGPLFIKDNIGNMMIHAQDAWIAKPPAISRGKEGPVYSWVFECAKMEIFAGGATA